MVLSQAPKEAHVMTTATRMQLGQVVQFRDHQGLMKPAIVTATPNTIDRGRAEAEVPPLRAEDELHLTVFSPSGATYPRHNIKHGSGPGQWSPL
jgi:hypothetical protein